MKIYLSLLCLFLTAGYTLAGDQENISSHSEHPTALVPISQNNNQNQPVIGVTNIHETLALKSVETERLRASALDKLAEAELIRANNERYVEGLKAVTSITNQAISSYGQVSLAKCLIEAESKQNKSGKGDPLSGVSFPIPPSSQYMGLFAPHQYSGHSMMHQPPNHTNFDYGFLPPVTLGNQTNSLQCPQTHPPYQHQVLSPSTYALMNMPQLK